MNGFTRVGSVSARLCVNAFLASTSSLSLKLLSLVAVSSSSSVETTLAELDGRLLLVELGNSPSSRTLL
jgi:hypothetical protein